MAEEVRLLLAELGFKSLEEAIGRADVLSARTDISLAKTVGMLDLGFITDLPDVSSDRCGRRRTPGHILENGDTSTSYPLVQERFVSPLTMLRCYW